MSSTVFLVPAAILASAFFGFFGLLYAGGINRKRTEIAYLINNQVCESIDRLNEYAYDYWVVASSATTLNKVENNILGLLDNISLQLTYLDENLHAFEYHWWQVFHSKVVEQKNRQELYSCFTGLSIEITSRPFGTGSRTGSYYEQYRKISQTAEEFKFLIRSRRLRY